MRTTKPTSTSKTSRPFAPEAEHRRLRSTQYTFGGLDQYAKIIDSDTDQVITSSWAALRAVAQLAEPGLQEEENFLFQQAAAQGQTVLNAAGDTGDDTCNETRAVAAACWPELAVGADPASQPYRDGGRRHDDHRCHATPGRTRLERRRAMGCGGGGGISESWAMPAWQQHVALTATATDVSNAEAVEAQKTRRRRRHLPHRLSATGPWTRRPVPGGRRT